MAVAYESISTVSSNGASSTATIAKPSGLAVGDLMIAGVLVNSPGLETVNDETGWTTVGTAINAHDQSIKVFRKIADSGDVAATNFIFDFSASATGYNGFIMRISGANTTSPIGAVNQAETDNSTAPSMAAGVTPAYANSLLLMIVAATSPTATITQIGSYAIATSNPTWTERADLSNTGSADHCFAVATATRPETTATGNVSFTGTGVDSNTDWHVYLIAVSPALSFVPRVMVY